MHLIRFEFQDRVRLGAIRNGQIVDLSAASNWNLPTDTSALLRGDGGGLAAAQKALDSATGADLIDPEAVKLLAPVAPGQILCLGLNYRLHAEESGLEIPEWPIIFTKSPGSVIAPGEPIILPKAAPDRVDYEAELVFVIGRQAKNVSRNEALDYVAGYTCANDVSARDLQMRTSQWTLGKLPDSFCPLGPALVTADEIPDPHGLAIRCHLNGQEMQSSNTDDLIFDIPAVIKDLTSYMTLYPGDVVLTGTPSGVGFARKPPVFLKQGDVVEISIEGLGTLANPVVGER
jgi:2-keto-4-pentenoate hydratase/2-oxohepta-3-ene-1,7-dioic acid hydratase in catechol pathway